MKSEWRATSNYVATEDGISDEKVYTVYRLIDVNEVDHSGNREYRGGYVSSREIAVIAAEMLNEKGRCER